ncbi:MAG: hypothetical protein BHK79_02785 [Halanaerobium sp. MDAL1]|nr:MAG: hypothetical protein BHK79_02785 [Halanaerobium sp. MDAL1]
MQNILIDMFKEFNQKSDVIYFIDLVDKEVKYSKGDGKSNRICFLSEVENAEFKESVIRLEGDKIWQLTYSGPKISGGDKCGSNGRAFRGIQKIKK